MYFGDSRDTATYIPPDAEQTNIRRELRASLRALDCHRPGEHMLVCPDCQLIVNGMLGWVPKWRRHGWANAKGPVQHRGMWELLLCLTGESGKHVKWLHIPSHIETPGNTRADHLGDVGRRQLPLLFGQISVYSGRRTEPKVAESDEDWDEDGRAGAGRGAKGTRNPRPPK